MALAALLTLPRLSCLLTPPLANPAPHPRSTRLLENELRVLRDESSRLTHEKVGLAERITENHEKIKLNNQLPYLVANIVEVLDVADEEGEEEDGAITYQESGKKGKCVVLKTSTRQTVFLPVAGLVDPEELKPSDLVGVNKDSYLILDTLPAEYDSRVKAMEVDEKPTEDYSDIGGLDKQIQELREAIVLPITHKDRFKALGIRPPKGVLLFGPPGTGKTLIARACAAQTNATFLKLAGPSLVQMFIGDGAKMVRDAFALAKEKVRRGKRAVLQLAARKRPPACADPGRPSQPPSRQTVVFSRCLTAADLLPLPAGAGNHLHRRDRRHRHHAARLGDERRP